MGSLRKLIEQRGYKDTGLEGLFRDKVHDIEEAVEAGGLSQLTIDMLTMRRSNHDRVEDYAQQFKVDFHPAKN